MNGRQKVVFFCIDTLVATSKLFEVQHLPIQIELKIKTRIFLYNIELKESNVSQSLEIKHSFEKDPIADNTELCVLIYIENTVIINENIKLNTNMIGSLNYSGEISFHLIFRVINEDKNEIIIYKVPRLHLKDFEIVSLIKSGSYGNVYEFKDSFNQKYAFKIMFNRIDINNKDHPAIREIIPFISLPKHPCLISLVGFIYNSNYGIILVLEYASRGRIDTIDFNKLDDDRKVKILYGLFSCVASLHDHGFIHRDIHPSNVLVTEDYEVRMIDFGVSRFYDTCMTRNVGHPEYKSHEMTSSRSYNELVDEFSLGKLLSNVLLDIYKNESWRLVIKCLLDNSCRIESTEVCALIEGEFMNQLSEESFEYITKLSIFHESRQLKTETLTSLAFTSLEMKSNDYYCDLFKLIDNIKYQEDPIFFNFIILFYDGVALDIEITQTMKYSRKSFMSCPSEEKIDLLSNYFIDCRLYSKEEIGFILFTNFHHHKFIEKYFFWISIDLFGELCSNPSNVFYQRGFFTDFINSLVRISKEKNLPNYLFKFFYSVSHYRPNEFTNKEFTDLINEVNKCNASINHLSNIKEAVNDGNHKLAIVVGKYYLKVKEYKTAHKYFNLSADDGNVYSMFMAAYLSIMEFFDYKIPKNGIEYLKTCANKGDIAPQIILAELNFHGELMPKNMVNAFWYNSLSLRESNNGYFIHGLFLFNGEVVKQDFTSARFAFEQSNDYVMSNYYLSIIHLLGLEVDVDIEKARHYCYQTKCKLSPFYDLIHKVDKYILPDDMFILIFPGNVYAQVSREIYKTYVMQAIRKYEIITEDRFVFMRAVQVYYAETLLTNKNKQ